MTLIKNPQVLVKSTLRVVDLTVDGLLLLNEEALAGEVQRIIAATKDRIRELCERDLADDHPVIIRADNTHRALGYAIAGMVGYAMAKGQTELHVTMTDVTCMECPNTLHFSIESN